ncbi:hypothetical protein [Bradyrhizobium sp. 23]|uniref:hypothetical protein n=1 Tax=Bradyrhizobium sp. 23 TaxID=2782667 RepID=UPI001FFA325E|nr:hypothetical protein [Bradyrhizobium sp. 23]MCK1316806.1 hypothetical protein [Bradyrhizobium sp. 23]
MLRIAIFLIYLLSASNTASAKTRLYPICFFGNARPDQTEINDHYVPMLISALRAAAYLAPKAKVVASPDGKWLIADTSRKQNARIASIWSRLACIGNATNSDRIRVEQACFDYVHKVVSLGQSEHVDQNEVGGTKISADDLLNNYSLYCKTVGTNSDP